MLRKLSRIIGLRGQPEQILRLFPRGLRVLRQRQEPGCLVRSGLDRQCMIEILQTCIAGSAAPCAAGRTPTTAAVSSVLTQSAVVQKSSIAGKANL